MPSWLATNTSETSCHYKGINSPPTNFTKWGLIIENMARHILARYGEAKAKEMMFEVW